MRRLIDPETQEELLVPDEIDDTRAIEHARRGRRGELRRIRFFLDYGHGYPLWESGSDSYVMTPDDYGLSPELARRLRDWALVWERHHDPFTGWDDETRHQRWLTDGDALVAALEIEIYDVAVVLPEFRKYGM